MVIENAILVGLYLAILLGDFCLGLFSLEVEVRVRHLLQDGVALLPDFVFVGRDFQDLIGRSLELVHRRRCRGNFRASSKDELIQIGIGEEVPHLFAGVVLNLNVVRELVTVDVHAQLRNEDEARVDDLTVNVIR